ncbi:MAG TPA: glycosyltransferase family 9 protein [Chitinophagaceae bacterium]|nr:glycosyltransferase family 9 protein [Chitinophagaceae bacterium]
MKFLVIRFSSIGDIVLTTPVVRCLKQQVENAEVHFLTKKNFASILENNPHVDKVHVLEDDLGAMIKKLSGEKFDAVIDLHNNLRSARVKFGLGVPSHSFPKLNIEKWLMVKFKINRLPDIHIVDRYLGTVSSFGVKNDMKGLDYFIPAKDEIDISTMPFREYTGIVIGAAHATKRLPLHKLIEMASKILGPLVLLGGKEDVEIGEQVRNSDPVRIFNACGKYNLNQSASLVKQARAIVSHDTGLMHIAAAFHKPIVSVWGNTIPAFGMYPYWGHREFSLMSEVSGLACRPCSKIGYDQCPKGHFKCMENQDLNKIAGVVNAVK